MQSTYGLCSICHKFICCPYANMYNVLLINYLDMISTTLSNSLAAARFSLLGDKYSFF